MHLSGLKKLLRKNKIFVAVRFSPTFISMWLFFRPAVKSKIKLQNEYYAYFLKFLKPGRHIAFDIGANEGFVTEGLLENGLSVVAVEPDTRNVLILKRRFSNNSLCKLYPAAAGANNGELDLYLQNDGTAFSTFSLKWKKLIENGNYRFHSGYADKPVKVQATTLDQLISENGLPSLIKIDVEGYEAAVLQGLSAKIPLLLFEANLPQFIEETFACIAQLYRVDENVLFNYSASFTMCLKTFVTYTDFCILLPGITAPNIDIICVMPVYFDYYDKLP